MAYLKKTWQDDVTPISATNMNHIEQGIFSLGRVTGTYAGNGATIRTISLGFTPTSVTLCTDSGIMRYNGSTYGGIAVTGGPCVASAGEPAITIIANGFYVYNSGAGKTNLSPDVYNYTANR